MRIRVEQLGRGGFGNKGRWGTIAGGAAARDAEKPRTPLQLFRYNDIHAPLDARKNTIAVFSVVSLCMISLMMCTLNNGIEI